MSLVNNIPNIGDVLGLLPEYEIPIKCGESDPVRVADQIVQHAPADAIKILPRVKPIISTSGRGTTITGIFINELHLFRISMFLTGGAGDASGPNARNIYFAVFIPTVSVIDQFFSIPFGKNDLIRITKVSDFVAENLVSYLDVNFYLRHRINVPTEYNGSIDETITSYQYGVSTFPDTINLVCAQGAILPGLTRRIPIEWTTDAGCSMAIMFRVIKGNSGRPINFNKYYKVEYVKDYFRTNSYYSLSTEPPTSTLKTPIKVNYPINSTARANYNTYVSQYTSPTYDQKTVFPYFGFTNSVNPGQAIDSAYKAQQSNYNILFDNRACTYFTTRYFVVQPYDQIIMIIYNHKREVGRCRYDSVTVYNGSDNTISFSDLVIPDSVTPINDYLLAIYVNNFPDVRTILVAERIYQYPAPNYSNCQMMSVFVKTYTP